MFCSHIQEICVLAMPAPSRHLRLSLFCRLTDLLSLIVQLGRRVSLTLMAAKLPCDCSRAQKVCCPLCVSSDGKPRVTLKWIGLFLRMIFVLLTNYGGLVIHNSYTTASEGSNLNMRQAAFCEDGEGSTSWSLQARMFSGRCFKVEDLSKTVRI